MCERVRDDGFYRSQAEPQRGKRRSVRNFQRDTPRLAPVAPRHNHNVDGEDTHVLLNRYFCESSPAVSFNNRVV